MTQDEKVAAAMRATLSEENKARHDATLEKIMACVDVTSDADVIASVSAYAKVSATVTA